jgi:hypothetical protein
MSRESVSEWKEIDMLIGLFCKASGLLINHTKTIVHYEGLSEADLAPFKLVLPFTFSALSGGFKYLGYYLKTGAQRANDWD